MSRSTRPVPTKAKVSGSGTAEGGGGVGPSISPMVKPFQNSCRHSSRCASAEDGVEAIGFDIKSLVEGVLGRTPEMLHLFAYLERPCAPIAVTYVSNVTDS